MKILRHLPDITISFVVVSSVCYLTYLYYQNFKNMPTVEEQIIELQRKNTEMIFCENNFATSTLGSLPVKCLKYYTSAYFN